MQTLTPNTSADVARASALGPVKCGKLEAETLAAVAALPDATVAAIKLAETDGPMAATTLAAWQHVSTLGLTIGRRARIRGGLPRGG